ncbi:MAG: hypothetical protein OEZ11_01145, partial [Gammaproteobacteria bacterium]|nr:hypothetical protein [Gammaproteobacteria bacterium]
MNRFLALGVAVLVLGMAPQPAVGQAADADMRKQFEAVIDGLNDNVFDAFQRAVDEDALVSRIFGTRVI